MVLVPVSSIPDVILAEPDPRYLLLIAGCIPDTAMKCIQVFRSGLDSVKNITDRKRQQRKKEDKASPMIIADIEKQIGSKV